MGDKDVPAYESWTITSGYYGRGELCFGANGKNDDIVKPYLTAIKEIKLNDKSLAPVNNGMFLETGKYYVDSGTAQTIRFDAGDFSTTDSTTITIIADGYKNFTLVIGADGKVVTGGDSGETPGGDGEVTAKEPPMNWRASSFMGDYTLTSSMGNDDFMKAISEVSVNGNRYEKGYVSNNDVYSTNETDGVIKLGSGKMTSTPNVVVIKATGYKDLTLTIAADKTVTATVGDSSGSGSNGDTGEDTVANEALQPIDYETSILGGSSLYFDKSGSNADAAKAYLNKISEIKIGDSVLSESDYTVRIGTDSYISFSDSVNVKNIVITIKATGYKDQTITIDAKGKLV